jgi:pyruvate kinase
MDTNVLINMLDAGMNIARVKLVDQMDHNTGGIAVANVRDALKQRPDKSCAIMLDTQGPVIKTGNLKDGKPVEITSGSTLKIVTDKADFGDNQKLVCDYEKLPVSVSVGSTIFIDDGKLHTEVTEIGEVSNI